MAADELLYLPDCENQQFWDFTEALGENDRPNGTIAIPLSTMGVGWILEALNGVDGIKFKLVK